jgi:hypothetical protein
MQEPPFTPAAFPAPASSTSASFATFDDFYPYYLTQHRNPINRAAHYVGTTAVLGAVAIAAATLHPAWLLLAPLLGYGPAFVGHFVFEKNKPATFDHPLWSIRADFRMYFQFVRGRMSRNDQPIRGRTAADPARSPAAAA